MRSAAENFFYEVAMRFRVFANEHDRAVVLGACLSFTPIAPACWLGVILSLVNLFLLKTNRLSVREGQIIRISLVVSSIFSLLWAWLAYRFVGALASAANDFLDLLFWRPSILI